MKLSTLFESEMKDYKVIFLHKPSRMYAWAKWYPNEEKWKIDFRDKVIELKDLKNIPSEFEISSGGSSSMGGEKCPYPKNVEVKEIKKK